MTSSTETGVPACELCGLDAGSKHHLIPRARHKNKRNKKWFSHEEVKEKALMC